MSKKTYGQFFRFASVGIINTVLGMAIMFCLYNVFGVSYWLSSAVNYTSVSILSYILNKKFTFRHSGKVFESGAKFVVNIAVCYFAAYGIAKPLVIWIMNGDGSVSLQENIAMLTGMCIFTGLNYLGQRFLCLERKIWSINQYITGGWKVLI